MSADVYLIIRTTKVTIVLLRMVFDTGTVTLSSVCVVCVVHEDLHQLYGPDRAMATFCSIITCVPNATSSWPGGEETLQTLGGQNMNHITWIVPICLPSEMV